MVKGIRNTPLSNPREETKSWTQVAYTINQNTPLNLVCRMSRYPDVEWNPGPVDSASRGCHICARMSVSCTVTIVIFLSPLPQIMMCCCALRFLCLIGNICRRYIFQISGKLVLKLRDAFSRDMEGWWLTSGMVFLISKQNRLNVLVCEMLILRICGSIPSFICLINSVVQAAMVKLSVACWTVWLLFRRKLALSRLVCRPDSSRRCYALIC